jgi:hypothetical protein
VSRFHGSGSGLAQRCFLLAIYPIKWISLCAVLLYTLLPLRIRWSPKTFQRRVRPVKGHPARAIATDAAYFSNLWYPRPQPGSNM